MLDSRKVFIFGYSGHAYVVIESLIELGYSIEGYFDFEKARFNPYDLIYYGFERDVDVKAIVKENLVFPAVGDNNIRKKMSHFFKELNLKQFVAIDKSANVSSTTSIGYSSYIGKNVVINAQSKIGQGVIINTGVIVEHESVIGNGVHIAPGTVLAGNTVVGDVSFIGANSVLKQGVIIGSSVIVGAGSVVIKDIPDNEIHAGNPAKRIK